MVSKNRKDITKHYTLNDVPLQLQMEAFGIFRLQQDLIKVEPRLLVSAVDLGEGLCVTFDSSKSETTN